MSCASNKYEYGIDVTQLTENSYPYTGQFTSASNRTVPVSRSETPTHADKICQQLSHSVQCSGSRLVTPTIAGKTYPVPYQHSEAAGSGITAATPNELIRLVGSSKRLKHMIKKIPNSHRLATQHSVYKGLHYTIITLLFIWQFICHAKTDVIGVIENYHHVQEIDTVMDREISYSSTVTIWGDQALTAQEEKDKIYVNRFAFETSAVKVSQGGDNPGTARSSSKRVKLRILALLLMHSCFGK
ncbi:hypothetical protein DCAR_0209151 [Daucus carota subsp. sativus]|uniref:Uncharacterized protein n=1 Tax=Daucus carota subsp. sativus TaxID=79200 RepID=A0A166F2L4_DAUCS|nr:hypothetical protein DCAR_0209151 [Daucus carota subsp. sativus]